MQEAPTAGMALTESLPSHVLSGILGLLPPNEGVCFACVSRSGGAASALLQGLSLQVTLGISIVNSNIED